MVCRVAACGTRGVYAANRPIRPVYSSRAWGYELVFSEFPGISGLFWMLMPARANQWKFRVGWVGAKANFQGTGVRNLQDTPVDLERDSSNVASGSWRASAKATYHAS